MQQSFVHVTTATSPENNGDFSSTVPCYNNHCPSPTPNTHCGDSKLVKPRQTPPPPQSDMFTVFFLLLLFFVSQIRSIKQYNKILNTHFRYIYNILKFAKFQNLPITNQDNTKKRKWFPLFPLCPVMMICES